METTSGHEKLDLSTGIPNKSLNALLFALVLIETYAFLVGIREIVLKNAVILLLVAAIVFLLFGGFVAALLLKLIDYKWVILGAALLTIAGRLMLLFAIDAIYVEPVSVGGTGRGLIEIYPLYYFGAACTYGGYTSFLVALIGAIGKWRQTGVMAPAQHESLVRVLMPAYLFAYGLNLISRLLVVLHDLLIQPLLMLAAVVVVVQFGYHYPEHIKGINPNKGWKCAYSATTPYPPRKTVIKQQLLLLQWAFLNFLLVLPYLQPELLAYQAGIGYGWIQLVLFLTTAVVAGILFFRYYSMVQPPQSQSKIYLGLLVANIINTGLFGAYLYFPSGQPALLLVFIFTFLTTGLNLGLVFREFWCQPSPRLELYSAFIIFLTFGGTLALRLSLISAHVPFLWFIIFGLISAMSFAAYWQAKQGVSSTPNTGSASKNDSSNAMTTTTIKHSHEKSINPDKAAALAFCFLVLLPALGGVVKIAMTPPPNVPHDVWASLYTWYGTPSEPAGMYGLPQFDGSAENWSTDYTTLNSPQIIANGGQNYFTGTYDGLGGGGALVLNCIINKCINPSSRTYFEINISAGTLQDGDILLEIYLAGNKYAATLLNASSTANQFYVVNKVFPFHFTNNSYSGSPVLEENQQEIRITQSIDTAAPAGDYNISINYLEISRWTHYDEDYHTVESEERPGYWYNDPPVLKATAHNAFYNQSTDPWSEIETYGFYNHTKWNEIDPADACQYGIYDSLDPVTIRSQLRLMEKAGIDAVQIMHPWGLYVVNLIFDLAISINSNLTFFLYGSANHTYVAQVMNEFAYNPIYSALYYRINGRPVYNYGFTAYVNEIPIAALNQQVKDLRRMYPNIYLIGDGFSSPYTFKEELLDILDGWYYYDTSAFYRHGWGDPRINNYQADGTLPVIKPHNQLDRIFGMQASLAHSKGKTYCAIVIPGTDNTCVHDFTGSPLYDGRTGTINERAGGLTFDLTWEAAIKAGADQVCIVSWNELHEGTEIEPTIEDGVYYVQRCAYWAVTFENSS